MSFGHRRLNIPSSALSLIVMDAIGVVCSFLLALEFRFDGQVPVADLQVFLLALPVILAIFLATNFAAGLYRYVWRYTSANEVITVTISSVVSTLIVLALSLMWGEWRPIPMSVTSLGGVFSCGFFVVSRYRERLLTGLLARLRRITGTPSRRRVLIIGAGEGGNLIARQLRADTGRPYELVGFVDDDPRKLHLRLHGAQVLGDRNDIPSIVAERGVSLIVIAIHQLNGPVLRNILSICLATDAQVKILPDFLDTMEQARQALPLRNIGPEDLLGRELCAVDAEACRSIVSNKVVLVTGAAGSIGSELCRQLLALRPSELLLLDNNETGVHDLYISLPSELRGLARQIVADVTNKARMAKIFAQHRPQAVFHVAAYKHVPMMEHHPDEAVRVNVWGTAIVADLAAEYEVERFVLISTDKAVNPSSIMGATKRVGELLMMSKAEQLRGSARHSLFTAVRFGNVLGSRGSVVPTFVRQIEQGGPVTITDTQMTRYFISISEAVSLVIQAATMTEGGEIFMLDMGQAIRIEDLARKLIRLRGLRPGQDIPIAYNGIRPGEKLHEELTGSFEQQSPTPHPKLFRIRSRYRANLSDVPNAAMRLVGLALEQRREDLVDGLWQLVQDKEEAPALQNRVVGEPMAVSQ